MEKTQREMARAWAHGAHNYAPLDVVLARGQGAWVWDVEGRRYLDMLAGYSSLNFGHLHPEIVETTMEQLGKMTLCSRAFGSDQFGTAVDAVSRLTGKDAVVFMNSGSEAVETAIKLARRWGSERGITEPKIIVMDKNFHGRTTTIISFSDDPDSRRGFGPYTPGFIGVPFGDTEALDAAMGPDVAGVLLEPIQGEAGVIAPPRGYLQDVRDLCTHRNILMMCDEIQSGLGRTGFVFASDIEEVVPDVYILGKALGGGIMAVSAVACSRIVMDVLGPGSHGSTFGGNPLACAITTKVVELIERGDILETAKKIEVGLRSIDGPKLVGLRVVGAWAGLDVEGSGREMCEELADLGVLAKETHGSTLRLSPPLVTSSEDLAWGIEKINQVLA